MKTVAMVLEAFNKPLVMREFELPALIDGEVLIKVEAAGVCGSDVHMWKGEDPRTPLPIILGHEGVGRVLEIKGSKKTVSGQELKAGDLIIWNRGMSCHACYSCAVLNEPSICTNRKVYGINRSSSIRPYVNGCYSREMILAAETDIFRVEREIDPAILVSASCSGATVAHAFDLHSPSFGETVVIQGPGPLGVYAAAFARHLGALDIIVIGGSDNRLALCQEFGATLTLHRKELSLERRKEIIMERTGGRGADVVIEAVGDPSAVHEGIKLVRTGGTYLSIGFSQPPGDCQVDFFQDVVRKNLKIQGVWVSATRHTWQSMKLVVDNPELFAKMITHRYPLAKANEALQAMAGREALKAVLVPG
jgi:threonine dehydrogenase-like Zn-dependent dehydrogenase